MGGFIERPRFTCALGGALITATALPNTVPVVHGPPGCAGNLAWTQAGGCGLQVGGYCGGISMPGSNIQDREVIFGGGQRLEEQLKQTFQIMDGDLYIVLTSCVTELIGDDVHSIVQPLAEQGRPVVFAETGGFKGNSYLGYDLVLQSLFKNHIKTAAKKKKRQVNLWGIPPAFDVFWRGNLEELRQLLGKLGLEVNTFFTVKDTSALIRNAGKAELNIVVSEIFGLGAAETAKEVHDIPYISLPLPIGPSASSDFLRKVSAALKLDQQLTEQVIEQETKEYYQLVDPLTDCYNDIDLQRYAAIVGDANYAVAVTRFLADDLGWLPEAVAITDNLDEAQQEQLAARLNGFESGFRPNIIYSGDTSVIRAAVNEHWRNRTSTSGKYSNSPSPAFVIGSSLDRELAKDLNAAHLSVSFPVSNRAIIDRGYAGYRGGLRLTEDLIGALVAGR